jgi:hypothetical protein
MLCRKTEDMLNLSDVAVNHVFAAIEVLLNFQLNFDV